MNLVKLKFVNEHMHTRISHHRVDENYVDDICGIFFETWTEFGNMESAMFDEESKVEVVTIAASYEAKFGTTHEAVHDLVAIDDQEEDKVIQEFLMRLSIDNITVEDSLNVVEEAKKEEKDEKALIMEH